MFGLEAELSSKHPEAVSATRNIAKRETTSMDVPTCCRNIWTLRMGLRIGMSKSNQLFDRSIGIIDDNEVVPSCR